MANITLMGASYTDVPAVDLPQTGGGTVRFYENGGGGGSGEVEIEVISSNLHDTSEDVPNVYINGSSESAYNGWSATGYIPVKPDTYYQVLNASGKQYNAFYKADKTAAKTSVIVPNSSSDSKTLIKTTSDTYYIRMSGTTSEVANYEIYEVNVVDADGGGSSVKTATGTFTGNGTRQITISCDFEPDLIYWTSNPGTTASSGTVAGIIAREMMSANRYRNNATSNSHYAVIDITDMNTDGSSYSFRATYANNTVTLYCFSNNARSLFTNGRTYTYQFVKWTT